MEWAVKNDNQFIWQRIAIEQLFSTIGKKKQRGKDNQISTVNRCVVT